MKAKHHHPTVTYLLQMTTLWKCQLVKTCLSFEQYLYSQMATPANFAPSYETMEPVALALKCIWQTLMQGTHTIIQSKFFNYPHRISHVSHVSHLSWAQTGESGEISPNQFSARPYHSLSPVGKCHFIRPNQDVHPSVRCVEHQRCYFSMSRLNALMEPANNLQKGRTNPR